MSSSRGGPTASSAGCSIPTDARFRNTGRNGWINPRYAFTNVSPDIRAIFCAACELPGLRWTASGEKTIYVSRKDDVALLDLFVGPKR